MSSGQFAKTTVLLLMSCAPGAAMADAKSDYIEIVSKAVIVLDREGGPITSFIVSDDVDADLVIALNTVAKVVQRTAVPKSEMYTLPKGYFIVEDVRYENGNGKVIGIAGPGALKGTLGAKADCGKRYSIAFFQKDGKWENGPYETKSCVAPAATSESVAKLQDAAGHGDAEAQFRLGLLYLYGDGGLAKDEARALMWNRKAAEQGNAKAQIALGYALANGKGVAKDEAEAVSWYRKAALQGNAMGQSYLGAMLVSGRGVKKDAAQAAIWYRKAAEQGDTQSQLMLGSMLQEGLGVPRNETEAAVWYRKAAEHGSEAARRRLEELDSVRGH